VTLIDVREPDEYRTAHVAGARLIPLATVPEHLDALRDAAELTIICASGGRSRSAGEWLAEQGLSVVNVAGGTRGWIAAGLPVITGDQPE
jgi:rhodanese-related sulfurtransferase